MVHPIVVTFFTTGFFNNFIRLKIYILAILQREVQHFFLTSTLSNAEATVRNLRPHSHATFPLGERYQHVSASQYGSIPSAETT